MLRHFVPPVAVGDKEGESGCLVGFLLFIAAEYPSRIRCGQGGMAPRFPLLSARGWDVMGRPACLQPRLLNFVTRWRRRLQGHQTLLPAALQAWACSGAPLQVKPHPSDQRLSPGTHQPEKSLRCPSPAQFTAGPVPGAIMLPAGGIRRAQGWAMLFSWPWSIGELMVWAEL